MQERQLTLVIEEEFKMADTDGDGMVSLEEWRHAATNQPRIVKYAFGCKQHPLHQATSS